MQPALRQLRLLMLAMAILYGLFLSTIRLRPHPNKLGVFNSASTNLSGALRRENRPAHQHLHVTGAHQFSHLLTSAVKRGDGCDDDDRIEQQLQMADLFAQSSEMDGTPMKTKQILLIDGFPRGVFSRGTTFRRDHCPVRHCSLTDNASLSRESDAIIFQGHIGNSYMNITKLTKQVWIFYQLESPVYTVPFYAPNLGYINWTATYRSDSTLVTPYAKFIPHSATADRYKMKETLHTPNYAKDKTKLIAWFVSNCDTPNRRMDYVRELQRHLTIDIFGECGNLSCPKNDASECFAILRKTYKFYLAFENSNCKDYVTEKFFINSLSHQVVPIVIGARPCDYRRVAPPGSYIHVDDFNTPRQLASYLHHLNAHDKEYNKFFEWMQNGEFINTKFWCRLCAMLHATEGAATWYSDIDWWWRNPDLCTHSIIT